MTTRNTVPQELRNLGQQAQRVGTEVIKNETEDKIDKQSNNASTHSNESVQSIQRTSTSALLTFGLAIILHSLIEGLSIGVFTGT